MRPVEPIGGVSGGGGYGGGATGGVNDYMALLLADPLYRQEVNDLKAQSVSDASQMGSGILQALVDRGEVPDLAGSAAKLGLSPAIINWIRQNVDLGRARSLADSANRSGLSTQAQLDLAHRTNMGNIKSSLAARGLLRSGATPFLTGQEEHNYSAGLYGADRQLSDYINGAYQAFTKAEQGRHMSLEQALQDAYQRQQQQLDSAKPPVAATPIP